MERSIGRLAAVVLTASATVAAAQEGAPKVGDQVVLKDPTATVTLGDRTVAKGDESRVFRVVKIGQQLMFVASGERRGWAKPADLVPVDQEIEAVEKALDDRPNSALFARRGLLLAGKGDYDRAIVAYEQALKGAPRSAPLYAGRAAVYFAKGEDDRALADFDDAARFGDDAGDTATVARALHGRGNVLVHKGDIEGAIGYYTESLQRDSKAARVFLDRSAAFDAVKRYDRALQDVDAALKLDPNDPIAHYDRGVYRLGLRDYDRALVDFDRAIQLDPDYAPSHGARALILAAAPDPKLRDGKGAVEAAKRACDLTDSKEYHLLADRAAAHAEAGDFAAAVKDQRRSIELATAANLPAPALDLARDRLTLYNAKKPFRLPPAK
ncbi:MAG TPA: tetratricopeptide repeat protein [Isosphaeraceae bacterium]|jgi:tetratricopeptide (TPR) repeat protein|nr:tetratricopeptide repeat protein [Isosphaeraceae bacterium]